MKVQMAVVSVTFDPRTSAGTVLKNEKTLEMEDVIDTVYRYSRELEHSDPNLNLMEKLMRRDLLSWFKKENEVIRRWTGIKIETTVAKYHTGML